MLFPLLRHKGAFSVAFLLSPSNRSVALRVVGSSGDNFRIRSLAVAARRTFEAAMAGMAMAYAPRDGARGGNTRNSNGIVWFKHSDLRLVDHEPLLLAHRDCSSVAHVFCVDDRWFGTTKRGTNRMSASRCRFLLESVADLKSRLQDRGSDLIVRCGHPEDVIPDLAVKLGGQVSAVTLYAHTDVCSEEIGVHTAVKGALMTLSPSVAVKEFWGNTMHHPDDLPFDFPHGLPDIFTQFRKAVEQRCQIRSPLPTPGILRPFPSCRDDEVASMIAEELTVEQFGFEKAPERNSKAVLPFNGGETAGLTRVREYIWEEDRLRNYKETRNGLLGSGFSSKFSPWLALGCLSPKMIISEVRKYEKERIANDSTYWLIFELLWRDFFRYSAVKNGNSIFHLGGPRHDSARQVWRNDVGLLEAWKAGETGYPFIDANMRELKASGFMSNRGRQVVASFFTKDLGMDWRLGAEHFEEHLLDHDPASNWGNWNYVAGVGSDPREDRYFNIEKQAKTYDPEAEYIRHWLPELATLPTTALQSPGGITTMLRHMRNIPVSVYPDPIVPLKFSAARKGGKGSGGGQGVHGTSGARRGSSRGSRGGGRVDGKGGGSQGSGGKARKFKASRLQRDGDF